MIELKKLLEVKILNKDMDKRRNNRGLPKHGWYGTRTYKTWQSMIERCTNPNSISYRKYGARGVTVCAGWKKSFLNFLNDMGERPDAKSLDRIDSCGNYEPGNCRWATAAEQGRNSRNAKLSMQKATEIRSMYGSGGWTYLKLAKKFGVTYTTIRHVVIGVTWRE